MINNKLLDKHHQDVPADYYHHAIGHNIFQRFWHTRRFHESGKILGGVKAKKILDVGCHDGRFTYEISKLFPQASVYGIDISAQAIQFAKNKYPRLHFLICRAEKLPFGDNTFDLISCFEILEHVDNPKQVLQEMRRVLRPHGTLVILVPTENLLFQVIWFFWTHFGPGRVWHHTHVQKFRGHTLEMLLENKGFGILQKRSLLLDMLSFTCVRKTKS